MRVVAWIVIFVPFSGIAWAQSIDVGLEALHDRLDYHFVNDSKWNTTFLVPHFFEQSYSADKRLVVLRARADRWTFEAGVTGVQRGRGSDYDTFFQPDGDVVVHGHMVDVDLRSWRVAQTMKINRSWHLRAAFSRDQFHHPPGFSTTTHTQPPSSSSAFNDARQSVVSDVVEVGVGVSRTLTLASRCRLRGSVDVAPFTVARLTTHLPDSYPGLAIRFAATAYSVLGTVSAEWQVGRAVVVIAGQLGHAGKYVSRSSFTRRQAGASASLGWNAGLR